MTKLLATLVALLTLAGCAGNTEGVTNDDDGLYCFENFSYLLIERSVVPSPATLRGEEDLDCRIRG